MMDVPLIEGFDPEHDVLLRLFKSGDREMGALLGAVPPEILGKPRALDWSAAREDFLGWVSDRRKETSADKAEQRLGLAVSKLLPEAWRRHIDRCPGRWVVEAEPGLDAALVPWEAWLNGEYPVATERIPLIRTLDLGATRSPLPATASRLLILVGSMEQPAPLTGPARDLAREIRSIEQAAQEHSVVVVASAAGVVQGFGAPRTVRGFESREELAALLREGFHVVHYVGHSDEEFHTGATGLTFGEPVGAVTAQELAGALSGTCTRLLVLNACRVPDPMARTLGVCADHVVAMGARVSPAFTAAWTGPFYRTLLGEMRPVSEAVAAARRAIGNEAPWRRWVPCHWARTLDDQPLMSPAEFALERHRAGVIADHGPYLGALAQHAPGEDAIAELTIDLTLARPGAELRPLDRPWTVSDLVSRARELVSAGRPRFVLKAHPGGGKTTSLRKLARELAAAGPLVPYYESLADWPRAAGGKLKSFWPTIAERSADLEEALRVEAANGRLVLLLDGLDECRDASMVAHFLNHDLPEGDGVVVVATRIVFPRAALPARFGTEARLEPLDSEQQLDLLQRWFETHGLDRPADHARQLHAHMQGTSFLRELAGTPLYLTLAALLWCDPVAPQRPQQEPHLLYEQCLDYLLEGLYKPLPGEAQPIPDPPPGALAKRLLRLVALRGIERGASEIDSGSLHAVLALAGDDPFARFFASELERLEKETAQWCGLAHDLGHLLERIERRTGVIEGSRTYRRWRFPHKTFREALASLALRELYGRQALAGLKDYLDACGLGEAPEEALSSWAEVLAITTGWIAAGERDDWVCWLHSKVPRIGFRALVYGPGVSPATIVEVLGLAADRDERWETYRREIDAASDPLPAVGVIEGLIEAVRRLHAAGGDQGFRGGPVPDWAYLDDALRELALEHAEVEAAVELARKRILDALDEPSREDLQRLFSKVPGRETGEETEDLWAKVPAGRFRMGSPEDEYGRSSDEDQVDVELPDFWIGRTTVTWGQYRLFDSHKEHRWGTNPNLPVTEVSYFEAALFCSWLQHHGGSLKPKDAATLLFKLPSEAMWEYACRDAPGMPVIGHKGYPPFVTGESVQDLAKVARFDMGWEDGPGEVASRAAAGHLHLYDMHGNVWEWCADWYEPHLAGGPDPRGPGLRPSHVAGRVQRGGSFRRDNRLRSADRANWHPARTLGNIGFRVVLAPRPPAR